MGKQRKLQVWEQFEQLSDKITNFVNYSDSWSVESQVIIRDDLWAKVDSFPNLFLRKVLYNQLRDAGIARFRYP